MSTALQRGRRRRRGEGDGDAVSGVSWARASRASRTSRAGAHSSPFFTPRARNPRRWGVREPCGLCLWRLCFLRCSLEVQHMLP